MLEINNLTKKFDNLIAVQDVNLKLKKGDFFSIIGPNGSGKTTIIKNILGLLRPTAGQIKIGDVDISKEPRRAKAKMGYIPDEPTMWSKITGKEMLYFFGMLYGMTELEIKKEISKLLSWFHLQGIEENYFENYSRGNKQKFTILAALLHNPNLILVDEPIVGLDPDSAEIAMKLLTNFTKNGGTVFMATHTLSVAEKYSDKVGILHQGILKKTGTIKNLSSEMGKDKATLLEIYHYFSKND